MDFTTFVPREMISALNWLGRREWVEYGDIPERRAVWARPKEVVFGQPSLESLVGAQSQLSVTGDDDPWLRRPSALHVRREEQERLGRDHWRNIRSLTDTLRSNVVSTLWHYALSKCVAEGPKLFKASLEQCEDLEATDVPFPFAEYHQPYPTFIIEIPVEYRRRLAQLYNLPQGPSYVFCHHEPNRLVSVSAFFSRSNIITHITPNRPEYETLEDAIIKNRDRRVNRPVEGQLNPAIHHEGDFEAAEVVARLALNFGMYMTLIGVHVRGPMDPQAHAKYTQMRKSPNKDKARKARIMLEGTVYELGFNQVVKFHDEERVAQPREHGDGESHRAPPKPHRRRGHWRNQPHGPKNSLRKWIPIKPVLVRAAAFVGDEANTSVTYVPK